MASVISPILLGIIISLLGISNMKGNISSIHWYHRKRVTEETKKPFGKLVGLGTLIIGISLIIFGCFTYLGEEMQNEFITVVGSVIMVTAIITGLVMSFYAMIKYNKGIF